MISIREGNLLLQDDIEIIAHVTNCKGVMGAGIAKALADKGGNIKENVSADEANEIKAKLEEAGATVELA